MAVDRDKLQQRLTHLRGILSDVVEGRGAALLAESFQGMSALVRQELALISDIAVLEEELGALAGDLTLEQQIAEWRKVVGDLPDQVMEVFREEYDRRYRTELRLVK